MDPSRRYKLVAELDTLLLYAQLRRADSGILPAEVLEQIALVFGCLWAFYWVVDDEQGVLRPASHWASSTIDARELLSDTQRRCLVMSEGNAGLVWRSRRPIWACDLPYTMCLPRSLEAVDCGLRAGVWFAVQTEDAVLGVVELLAMNLESPSDELLRCVTYFGFRLSSAVARGARVLRRQAN